MGGAVQSLKYQTINSIKTVRESRVRNLTIEPQTTPDHRPENNSFKTSGQSLRTQFILRAQYNITIVISSAVPRYLLFKSEIVFKY